MIICVDVSVCASSPEINKINIDSGSAYDSSSRVVEYLGIGRVSGTEMAYPVS